MKKTWTTIITIIAVSEGLFILGQNIYLSGMLNSTNYAGTTVSAAAVTSPFVYAFDAATGSTMLSESGSMDESASPFWWLNSGGELLLKNGFGSTLEGSIAEGSRWQVAYNRSNPTDTDGGYHPQNIFRLVTRSRWINFRQEAYFKITKDELSESENRNASNGLLFFHHYQDGQNLYYAGIRVDGNAVIKKKIGGIYYTLAIEKIFPGIYDHESKSNLLPHGVWIGLRTLTKTNQDGSVSIKLYTDKGVGGDWSLVLEATDNGVSFGGGAIKKSGFAGIRTDFMDVAFKGYKLETI